jgi:hypothetical protein
MWRISEARYYYKGESCKCNEFAAFRFPRGSLVGQAIRRTHLTSYFGIGEALAEDLRSNMLEASAIMGQFSEVVTKNLFVEVAEKMERFDRNIGSLQLALEKTPEVFESVGVNLPVNVSLGMVNDLMLESLCLESLIGHERVGVYRAACLDVSANVLMEQVFLAIADDSRANLTTTFQDSHNGGFILGASFSNPSLALVSVHVASSPANESFVHFNLAIGTTKFQERTRLHGKTNAMEHEPSRLLSDAKSTSDLIRTDSVLAVGDHPNGEQPLVERKRRIFKDSSDLGRELTFGMDALALPLALILEEHDILAATGGADHNAIGPANLDHEVEAIVGIGVVQHGLLESLWFGVGAHGVPHKPNTTKDGLIRQVYYCLCKC